MIPELTIIIPTYNEKKTIQKTIHEINHMMMRTSIPFEILVVDDNSPDGTGKTVNEMIQQNYPVKLITRTSDPGLSQSVVEGFSRALGNIIVVTDADLSHDISTIPQMYQEVKKGTDIVIGSRYMRGGGTLHWPIQRRIISSGATILARLLFPDITDPVSGFFAVKKDLVEHAPLKPRGYKILLEILGRSYWNTVKEIPYTFVNRKGGKSKLKTGTIIDYARQVIDIARSPGRSLDEVNHGIKFAIVGISGIFVNMMILAGLKEYAGFPLIMASFIAIEISIFSNFLLNDRWTFEDITKTKPWIYRFLSFNGVAIGGMIINIVVLMLLSLFGIYYLVGNLIGIIISFFWNFSMGRRITWKRQ